MKSRTSTAIEAHYRQWITNIAADIRSGRCPTGIVEHITKHGGKELAEDAAKNPPDWRHWSSSMHNLLAIFDEYYLDTPPTTDEKLARLREKYLRHPDTHTPEPRESQQRA